MLAAFGGDDGWTWRIGRSFDHLPVSHQVAAGARRHLPSTQAASWAKLARELTLGRQVSVRRRSERRQSSSKAAVRRSGSPDARRSDQSINRIADRRHWDVADRLKQKSVQARRP